MTLQALLERVEGASGPDREIDALIYIALEYPDWRLQVSCDLFPEQVQVGRIQEPEGTRSVFLGFGWRESPKFTASLDAAVGLVEKMLPEMNVSVTRHSDGRGACEMWVWVSNLFDDTRALNEANGHESRHQNVGAATPALALIAALLKALIEGERTKVLSQEMGE